MKSPSPMSRIFLLAALASLTALLCACAGKVVPDWQTNAKSALESATSAYLQGRERVEKQEFNLARSEIARTGRADLMALVALTRCASRVASLVLEECADFEKLRQDATSAERAYADFLQAQIQPQDIALLPPQHRAVAGANSDLAAAAALQEIDDPLSRLVAAGVIFRSSRATPAVLALAVDTASSQGWRRPLLAWLGVQTMRAEQAGDVIAAQGLRRRIDLIQGGDAVK